MDGPLQKIRLYDLMIGLRNTARPTITASLQCTNGGGTLHFFKSLQHSDDHSNSTGTNELDDVICQTRIAQTLPTLILCFFFIIQKIFISY